MSSKVCSFLVFLFLLITAVLPIIQGSALFKNDLKHSINETHDSISIDPEFRTSSDNGIISPFKFDSNDTNPLKKDISLSKNKHEVEKRSKREIRIRYYELDKFFNTKGITKSEINDKVKAEFDKYKLGVTCEFNYWDKILQGIGLKKHSNAFEVCKQMYFDIHENYRQDNYYGAGAVRTNGKCQINYQEEENERLKLLKAREKLEYFLRKAIWCESNSLERSDFAETNTRFIEKLMKAWKKDIKIEERDQGRDKMLKRAIMDENPELTDDMLKSVFKPSLLN